MTENVLEDSDLELELLIEFTNLLTKFLEADKKNLELLKKNDFLENKFEQLRKINFGQKNEIEEIKQNFHQKLIEENNNIKLNDKKYEKITSSLEEVNVKNLYKMTDEGLENSDLELEQLNDDLTNLRINYLNLQTKFIEVKKNNLELLKKNDFLEEKIEEIQKINFDQKNEIEEIKQNFYQKLIEENNNNESDDEDYEKYEKVNALAECKINKEYSFEFDVFSYKWTGIDDIEYKCCENNCVNKQIAYCIEKYGKTYISDGYKIILINGVEEGNC
uniref:Uncharacterized protein n=1 Tax=Meloidogyne enterolobii TaxID=390850 RepID=A0A6V7WNI2_MELEN|nr:unnamed protein product [Meloidogyne enterolobii]